jgi:hypothetical protein
LFCRNIELGVTFNFFATIFNVLLGYHSLGLNLSP